MPVKQITVCCNCEKRSCDGGVWELVSCIRNGQEELWQIPECNRTNCTLNTFGTKKEFQHRKLGDEVERERTNWVLPAFTRYRKMEM